MDILDEIKKQIVELIKEDNEDFGNINVKRSEQFPDLLEIACSRFPKCVLDIFEKQWENAPEKVTLKNQYVRHWLNNSGNCCND